MGFILFGNFFVHLRMYRFKFLNFGISRLTYNLSTLMSFLVMMITFFEWKAKTCCLWLQYYLEIFAKFKETMDYCLQLIVCTLSISRSQKKGMMALKLPFSKGINCNLMINMQFSKISG